MIRPSTSDAILKAAFELYGENPSASIADIAERAGVGRATFHRHFKGRDDLLVELAKTAIKELDNAAETAAATAESFTEALQNIMYAIIPLADRQWFLSREAVQDNAAIDTEYQRQVKEMIELIDQAKKEGSFTSGIPTLWMVQVFDSLIFAAWEMMRMDEATVKQAADLAWRTFKKGCESE